MHVSCAYLIMRAVSNGLLLPIMKSQKKSIQTYGIKIETRKCNGLEMEPPRWLAWLEELEL